MVVNCFEEKELLSLIAADYPINTYPVNTQQSQIKTINVIANTIQLHDTTKYLGYMFFWKSRQRESVLNYIFFSSLMFRIVRYISILSNKLSTIIIKTKE